MGTTGSSSVFPCSIETRDGMGLPDLISRHSSPDDLDLLPSGISKWTLFSILKYATPQRLQVTHQIPFHLLAFAGIRKWKESVPYSWFPGMSAQWSLRPPSWAAPEKTFSVLSQHYPFSLSFPSPLQFLFTVLLETVLLSFGERETSSMTTK